MCIGGHERFSAPSFAVLKEFPGAPYSWGIVIAAAGILLLAASLGRHWRLKAAALVAISVWSSMFASGAWAAMAVVPTAGTTGGPIYLLVAFWSVLLVSVDERLMPIAVPR